MKTYKLCGINHIINGFTGGALVQSGVTANISKSVYCVYCFGQLESLQTAQYTHRYSRALANSVKVQRFRN